MWQNRETFPPWVVDMKKITGLSLFLLATWSFSIHAADLRVRVFERGGDNPLPGIAVCLGTQARLDQFGARRTDEKGYVLFQAVPRARLLVTASMPGFMSEQESMVTSDTDRMLVLSLSAGGGGPRCPISNTAPGPTAENLAISGFAINDGAPVTDKRSVKLHYSLMGQATHYRASEQQDFKNAKWRQYESAPDFLLSAGTGVKVIYLQVRRHAKLKGAKLETVSPVVSDTITLQ
jgi:hypothetical protein